MSHRTFEDPLNNMCALSTMQLDLREKSATRAAEPVECLGMRFPDEQARRQHFTRRLRAGIEELHAKLDVPFTTVDEAVSRLLSVEGWPMGEEDRVRDLAERMRGAERTQTLLERWKAEVGFPHGEVETILRLSDPPYYTACPNPFLSDFIRVYGDAYDPSEGYHREPLAVNTREGKTDPLYTAHAYHTKVPYRAIVPAIIHYTEPGDVVLDAFSGSGMTGVAAQACERPEPGLRRRVEEERRALGLPEPKWGARRVILNDLSPVATFIGANYTTPFDVEAFERDARRILREVEEEVGWMYETLHADGRTQGRINYTVWSEVFSCPECASEVIFSREALDLSTKAVRDRFPCPSCAVLLSKDNLQRSMETLPDPATGEPWSRIRLVPVLINYSVGKAKFEKDPDSTDLKRVAQIQELVFPPIFPSNGFPIAEMEHGTRLAPKGFTAVHHLYLPRAAHVLARLWAKASQIHDPRCRNVVFFFVEQAVWGMSLLARYAPTHFSQVNQYLSGVYYVGSQHAECSPWYILAGKLKRLLAAFGKHPPIASVSATTTGTAARLPIPPSSIDYVFTDPPFGANIPYADLNFLLESWHHAWTHAIGEAVVDRAKKKRLPEYQRIMQMCFEEYHRVLKPGRWMTMVFSNSRASVWNAILEAMTSAGFVVASVRTLSKGQGSYRQVTSTAVKQDLVVSAYKPNAELERRFLLEAGGEDGAWAYVRDHLDNLPTFFSDGDVAEPVQERQGPYLFDSMVSFHVQRGALVPLSNTEFLAGLKERFIERDGMYFLPDQVGEYDRRRARIRELRQLQLFVNDEASAIQWIRQELAGKPQKLQDLTPRFIRETQRAWSKHEKALELAELLSLNFFCFDGRSPIPPQIVSWMKQSSRLRERIRKTEEQGSASEQGLDTEDPVLLEAGRDHWYVPDPTRAADLERLRERKLLEEFESYRASGARKLKVFRLEAVRAGCKRAWQEKDYATIVEAADRLPDRVREEDPKLQMWYHQALTRLGLE